MFLLVTNHSDQGIVTNISHSDSSSFSARIAHRGATLLSFHTSAEYGDMEILGGYRSLEDLQAGYASRNWVMAPFANRIPNGEYEFEGKKYILPEDRWLHGLVAHEDWELLEAVETPEGLMLIYTLDTLADGIDGYPFELLYVLTYTISLSGVNFELSATNLGASNAPYFVGWHMYFTLGTECPDLLELEIPALQGVAMDTSLVPLQGSAAYFERAKGSPLDFCNSRVIGSTVIDDYFVSPNSPVARLINPEKGVALEVQGERGCLIAFTSDPLRDAPRSALALEPMEMIANAYNRGECQQNLILAPGATRSYEASFTLAQI